MESSKPRIYVLHENDSWVAPLRAAFDELGLPCAEWFIAEGTLDLAVGGEFLDAVRVDTSLGFELCPADVCQVGDAYCPVGGEASPVPSPRFRIVRDFTHPIVDRYRHFLAANGIGIAGIEFIVDKRGDLYTYDVNTNTNYNADAEREAGVFGMRAIARYLGRELMALKAKQPEPLPASPGSPLLGRQPRELNRSGSIPIYHGSA